jgi:glycosyltransferase involved in cell wall biosynthesis
LTVGAAFHNLRRMSPGPTHRAADVEELAALARPPASCIWLAWERQRRSETLARCVGAEYIPLTSGFSRPWKYCVLVMRTIAILLARRPEVLFVQNPSVVLAALVCAIQPVFRYRVVMDRHSNLKMHTRASRSIKWRMFHALSRYSNRKAHLTIVTNHEIERVVVADGGRVAILQDPLPDMTTRHVWKRETDDLLVFVVCTFSDDEPIEEVASALRHVRVPARLLISGKPKPSRELLTLIDEFKPRVALTGFLADAEYKALMHACDFVIVLTMAEGTLVCGAYEALECGKPLVLSDTRALREYFARGAAYCQPTAEHIARAIDEVASNLAKYKDEARAQREWMSADWAERFAAMRASLSRL